MANPGQLWKTPPSFGPRLPLSEQGQDASFFKANGVFLGSLRRHSSFDRLLGNARFCLFFDKGLEPAIAAWWHSLPARANCRLGLAFRSMGGPPLRGRKWVDLPGSTICKGFAGCSLKSVEEQNKLHAGCHKNATERSKTFKMLQAPDAHSNCTCHSVLLATGHVGSQPLKPSRQEV